MEIVYELFAVLYHDETRRAIDGRGDISTRQLPLAIERHMTHDEGTERKQVSPALICCFCKMFKAKSLARSHFQHSSIVRQTMHLFSIGAGQCDK